MINSLLNTTIGLPFRLFSIFVIDEKFDFNKQTLGLFIQDYIKSLIISSIFIVILTYAVLYLIEWGGPYFYVYVWIFTLVFAMIMMWVFPNIIQPMFNKFQELEVGDLREAIEQLAKENKFPLTKIYKMDASKRYIIYIYIYI